MSRPKGPGRSLTGRYRTLREEREAEERQWPPRPLLPWRDVDHVGVMTEGFCLRCFGVADDPRHWRYALADGTHLGSYPLQATVFRGSLGVE